MHSRAAAMILMVVMAFAPSAPASGKKEAKVSVTFHLETEASDNPKMIFDQMTNGQKRFYRRLPDFSTRDIATFNPFPSDSGAGDYGVVFTLKGNAATRLAALSNANQGRWMIAQVNGHVADGVMIDKEISDGKIVIWKRVTLADIALFDKEWPRTGEKKKRN